MIRSVAATLTALVVMGGLDLPVHAGPISGTLSGDSTLTPTGTPGVFVQNYTGDGDDTTYGSFTVSTHSIVDFSQPPDINILHGSFLESFSQGTLFGTSSGSGTASGMGTATFMADLVITGGTGIFAGATGDATATGTLTSTGPTTESSTAFYTGSLATIPEPGSLALLVPAAVVLFRRRRRAAMAG
jgi:hypothetical protein